MLKLVAALGLAGALAAGVLFAPIGGRTIADRWNASAGPASFAANAWREARRALDGDGSSGVAAPRALPSTGRSSAKSAGQRPAAPAKRTPPGPLPVEHHTAEDRAALDRLLSERSR